MKVYSLLGIVAFEGSELLGVFGSREDLMKYVGSMILLSEDFCGHFDRLGYVESELGQPVDAMAAVKYL